MSKETEEWLNTKCLIGFTNKRGRAAIKGPRRH